MMLRRWAPVLLCLLTFRGFSQPVLTVNGVNANYATTHVFVDEAANDAVPLTILFSPGQANITAAEVYSNLNRRDRATADANGDGIEDGIVPPDGNTIVAGDDGNYYKAYTMTSTATAGQYSLNLNAQKTGAYRLTARFMVAGSTNWNWFSTNAPYTTGNRRDFAIVVSPKRALSAVIYELNALNIGAQGAAGNGSQRSTFVDLDNGPGSRPYDAVTNRFNLAYMTNLGVNWLWVDPIHPIGIDSSINSPYCVKNYFEVSPWMSKANTRPAGMQEFTNYVAAAHRAGLNIMMDEPFNHTAHDVELAADGIIRFAAPGNPGNWQISDQIRNREPRFYSLASNYWSRASTASNIALAPDRGDFGKYSDVYDVFYGVYAALVDQNPRNNTNYLDPSDWFDYSTGTGSFDHVTQNVWRYFSDALLFWLGQTGGPNGVDGIRADFGEGLPPQAWEYIINKTRSQKWDFVFLAESLNGGAPTYRSSRHFDIVNDAVLYDFRNATTAAAYQSIFIQRRINYGQCLMLWNSTSHDVGGYYTDAYQALIRYMVGGTIDGAPMIFYGQELGTSLGFGFSLFTTNGTGSSAEIVPDLYAFNSLQPVCAPANRTYALNQLYPVFAAVGQARQASPALCGANRTFLSPVSGTQSSIYAVAKYMMPNGAPNFNDTVFAFVNLDRSSSHSANYNVNFTQNGANLFGIQSGRVYNVKNLAAYTQIDPTRRNQFQIPGGISGSSLLSSGLPVVLNAVPAADSGWSSSPFEARYLKLYDVTPPPVPGVPASAMPYVIGGTVTFTWTAAVDSIGGISGYQVRVGTSPGASDVFNGVVTNTSVTVTYATGNTLYASVNAINNAGIQGPISASSSGTKLVDPSLVPLINLEAGATLLTWNSVAGTNYQVWAATSLSGPFTAFSGMLTATGSTTSYSITPGGVAQYYRVQVFP